MFRSHGLIPSLDDSGSSTRHEPSLVWYICCSSARYSQGPELSPCLHHCTVMPPDRSTSVHHSPEVSWPSVLSLNSWLPPKPWHPDADT